MIRFRRRFLIMVAATLVAFVADGCAENGSRTRVTLARFRQMTAEQLAGLQGTITYLGDELQPIPTLGFAAVGHRFDARNVLLRHREGPKWHYVNDYLVPFRFVATTAELSALIDSVGTLPQVADGHVDSSAAVSFALMNPDEGDTLVFEAVLNKANSRKLFDKLLAAMSANTDALQELRGMGCVTDMLPIAPPRDATSDVSVGMGNTWPDPQTRECAVTIHVTNVSRHPLSPPLTLVLQPRRMLQWVEAEGRTCRVRPSGADFATLPIDSTLAPGASVEMPVHFRTQYEGPIRFAAVRVFEGAGTR